MSQYITKIYHFIKSWIYSIGPTVPVLPDSAGGRPFRRLAVLATCTLVIMAAADQAIIKEHIHSGDSSAKAEASFTPLIAVPFIALFGYHLVTDHLVTEYDSTESRDPETGILYGAEAGYLGPEDSSGAVLLIHGFVGAGNNFNTLPQQLADTGLRVRIMRLPGHGTTPRDLEYVTADSMIRAVKAEIELLRKTHETVALVGHSMGATLALLAAADIDIDRLVIAAPYFGVTYKWYYVLKPEIWTAVSYPVVRWVYKSDAFIKVNRPGVKDSIVSYRWVPVHGLTILTELGRRAQSPDVLDSITCPVLLIQSRGDEAASPEVSEATFNAINSGDKRAVWLNTSNHHVFWDYEHSVVTDEILDFMGRPHSEK